MFRAGVSACPNHSSYTHRAWFCAMFLCFDVLACLFSGRFPQIAENLFALLIWGEIRWNAGWLSLAGRPIFALHTWVSYHPSRGVYDRNQSIRASSPRPRAGQSFDLRKSLASPPTRRGASAVSKTKPRSSLRHQHNRRNSSLNLFWESECYSRSYNVIVLPGLSMRHWLAVHKSLRGQSFRTTSHGIIQNESWTPPL